MGGAGPPARSPSRPDDAMRRKIAVGLFLAATFGMAVVLSLPVSQLTELPHRLPGPIQRALRPLEPFLSPFARGSNPRRPATSSSPSGVLAALGAPGRLAPHSSVGPTRGPSPTSPSPTEPLGLPRPVARNLSLLASGREGRTVADCRARVDHMRRDRGHRKCRRRGPHHHKRPRHHQRIDRLDPGRELRPARRWHARHEARRRG